MILNNSVFNIALCNSYCKVLNDWMRVNNELGYMWKEVAVAFAWQDGGKTMKYASLVGVAIKV
jgi:hypothetical protein